MNKTAAEMGNITMLRVYFMDLENSVQIDPDEMKMMGSQIWMKLKEPKVKSIKTKISRTVHVEGDPLLDCAVYTKNKSCSKCARKERVDIFTKEIG